MDVYVYAGRSRAAGSRTAGGDYNGEDSVN